MSSGLNRHIPSPVYKTAEGILPMAEEKKKVEKPTPPKAATALINGVGTTGIMRAMTMLKKANFSSTLLTS